MSTNVPDVPGYRNLALLGRGGFSSVFRAEDEHIGRVVAIKVIERFDASDPKARDRFLREVRAMGKLSGLPHVVDIHHAPFTADGRPCIVMPFVSGGSLADQVRNNGPLAIDTVVSVGRDLALALDAAHRNGISHRDVKPENILVDEDGAVWLTDFGISATREIAMSTMTESALSFDHAPPERFQPEKSPTGSEAQGDLYSLGSTLYFALTGTPPFGKPANPGDIGFITRVVEQAAPILDRPGAPSELVEIIARLLAKEPSQRFVSAAALADALEHTPSVGDARPLDPLTSDTSGSEQFATIDRRAAVSAAEAPSTIDAEINLAPPVAVPEGATVARPRAGVEQTVEEEEAPGGALGLPVPALIAAGVGVVLALLVVAYFALGSGPGDDSDESGGPATTVGSGANALLAAPSIIEVREVEDGGLVFTWDDPNEATTEQAIIDAYTSGEASYLVQISVNGGDAATQSFAVDDEGFPLAEQAITDIDVGGAIEEIDTASNEYCVSMVIFAPPDIAPDRQVSSSPVCVGNAP